MKKRKRKFSKRQSKNEPYTIIELPSFRHMKHTGVPSSAIVTWITFVEKAKKVTKMGTFEESKNVPVRFAYGDCDSVATKTDSFYRDRKLLVERGYLDKAVRDIHGPDEFSISQRWRSYVLTKTDNKKIAAKKHSKVKNNRRLGGITTRKNRPVHYPIKSGHSVSLINKGSYNIEKHIIIDGLKGPSNKDKVIGGAQKRKRFGHNWTRKEFNDAVRKRIAVEETNLARKTKRLREHSCSDEENIALWSMPEFVKEYNARPEVVKKVTFSHSGLRTITLSALFHEHYRMAQNEPKLYKLEKFTQRCFEMCHSLHVAKDMLEKYEAEDNRHKITRDDKIHILHEMIIVSNDGMFCVRAFDALFHAKMEPLEDVLAALRNVSRREAVDACVETLGTAGLKNYVGYWIKLIQRIAATRKAVV